MNYLKKRVSQIAVILLVINSPSVLASSVSGGSMTLNIDSEQLAAAFTWNNDPNRPSVWLEEYFDSAQAASRTKEQLLSEHIIPGPTVISGIGREFTVNGSSATGLNGSNNNVGNNFTFDANDLTGTATGVIGLGGAMRFRLNNTFIIDPVTGEEQGNRTITGYYSLEYDDTRVDATEGRSGWAVFNHHSFRARLFDLTNVATTLTGESLTLSGDLSLAEAFNHMGGEFGSIVGDFSFQTTVVPVPAAVWLFASGLIGLVGVNRRKRHLQVSHV